MKSLQLWALDAVRGNGDRAFAAIPLFEFNARTHRHGQPDHLPTYFHLLCAQAGTRYHPKGSGEAAEHVGSALFWGLHGVRAPEQVFPLACLSMRSINYVFESCLCMKSRTFGPLHSSRSCPSCHSPAFVPSPRPPSAFHLKLIGPDL